MATRESRFAVSASSTSMPTRPTSASTASTFALLRPAAAHLRCRERASARQYRRRWTRPGCSPILSFPPLASPRPLSIPLRHLTSFRRQPARTEHGRAASSPYARRGAGHLHQHALAGEARRAKHHDAIRPLRPAGCRRARGEAGRGAGRPRGAPGTRAAGTPDAPLGARAGARAQPACAQSSPATSLVHTHTHTHARRHTCGACSPAPPLRAA